MRKILFLLISLTITLYSSLSYADHGHRHHRHHGHHGHYGGGYGYNNYDDNRGYAPQAYYNPQPDGRSHQGLAGGVVGSVLGYEIADGNPLAAGLGAAAGSFLGNNIGRRY